MTGVAIDGDVLEGWEHVRQSVVRILTTPLNTRVMRRDFGSEVTALIDAPMTERVIMAVFAAVAVALEPRVVDYSWYGEPRFRLRQVEVMKPGANGALELRITGTHYPNGHLGDFTAAREAAADIVF